MNPEEAQQWLAILGTPTLGLVAVIVLILYREAVIHLFNALVDVAASWLTRK